MQNRLNKTTIHITKMDADQKKEKKIIPNHNKHDRAYQ